MNRKEAEVAAGRILVDGVAQDRYPSQTHMDLVEAELTPEVAQEYFEVLLDKVSSDRYPSITMIRRLQRLAGMLPEGSEGEANGGNGRG
jgi:hypothetical protein